MGITSILDAQNQKGTPDFAFHGCPSNDHLADNTVLRTRAGRPVDADVGCTPLGLKTLSHMYKHRLDNTHARCAHGFAA